MNEFLEGIWVMVKWICFGTGAILILGILWWLFIHRFPKDFETEEEMLERERRSK